MQGFLPENLILSKCWPSIDELCVLRGFAGFLLSPCLLLANIAHDRPLVGLPCSDPVLISPCHRDKPFEFANEAFASPPVMGLGLSNKVGLLPTTRILDTALPHFYDRPCRDRLVF